MPIIDNPQLYKKSNKINIIFPITIIYVEIQKKHYNTFCRIFKFFSAFSVKYL